MAIYPDHSAEIAAWTNIRRIAASLAEEAKNAQPFPKDLPPPSKQYPIHLPLDLPFPHLILEPISTIDLPDETRQKILNCLTRKVNDLRKDYASIYRRICLASPSMTEPDIDMLRRACQRLYQEKCLPFLEFQVQSLLSGVAKRQQQSSQDKRPAFNTVSFFFVIFHSHSISSPRNLFLYLRSTLNTMRIPPHQIAWFWLASP